MNIGFGNPYATEKISIYAFGDLLKKNDGPNNYKQDFQIK